MDGTARAAAPAEDLYAVLGVAADAPAETIRQAYRRSARACHPDVAATAEAAERFRQLAAAYEVLGDPGARRAYDRRIAAFAYGPGAYGPGAYGPGARGPGPVPTHRAPGPTWNPATRGPAAQAARARPSRREPAPARAERTSGDEWRLAIWVGRVLVALALVTLVAFAAIAVATATGERRPDPVPAIYCKTPDGWMECRQALAPR